MVFELLPSRSSAGRRHETQRGCLCDERKVAVSLQEDRVGIDRDDSYQTVDQSLDGQPGSAAGAIDGRGLFVVGQPANREQLAAKDEPAEKAEMLVVAGAGKHLHHDRLSSGKRCPVLQETSELNRHWASGAT